MSFVVATWNVQWQFGDWQTRQAAISDVVAALDADVVLLQESWPGQVERLAETLGYQSVWAGHTADDAEDDPERGMGNAILSRWPIEAHDLFGKFLKVSHLFRFQSGCLVLSGS